MEHCVRDQSWVVNPLYTACLNDEDVVVRIIQNKINSLFCCFTTVIVFVRCCLDISINASVADSQTLQASIGQRDAGSDGTHQIALLRLPSEYHVQFCTLATWSIVDLPLMGVLCLFASLFICLFVCSFACLLACLFVVWLVAQFFVCLFVCC